ncbi:protein PLANT CADMIUM RESISTANCE 11-like [Hordeum vulgare subsp. vulgare]|uniref:protein PLANT CADMIUM RESISTANCE 11-like n=1 Tax=Hordeum vulgare subsp. vulgare TaxID=112509 RepID=UPI000B472068|nr:protein PLANT CADMIUM RESISTANCE 11-like [Hordeum vulgare subsp. vulgare]
MANPNNASWSSGLCACTHDVRSCCLTLFCPCVVFGRIAEIVDKGATSCCKSGTAYMLLASATGLGACLYSCGYRSRLREQYGLEEKPCGDCWVHWFCEPCALCQEYRELQNRGFDMALGIYTCSVRENLDHGVRARRRRVDQLCYVRAGWEGNMERMGKSGATAAPRTQPGMTR